MRNKAQIKRKVLQDSTQQFIFNRNSNKSFFKKNCQSLD